MNKDYPKIDLLQKLKNKLEKQPFSYIWLWDSINWGYYTYDLYWSVVKLIKKLQYNNVKEGTVVYININSSDYYYYVAVIAALAIGCEIYDQTTPYMSDWLYENLKLIIDKNYLFDVNCYLTNVGNIKLSEKAMIHKRVGDWKKETYNINDILQNKRPTIIYRLLNGDPIIDVKPLDVYFAEDKPWRLIAPSYRILDETERFDNVKSSLLYNTPIVYRTKGYSEEHIIDSIRKFSDIHNVTKSNLVYKYKNSNSCIMIDFDWKVPIDIYEIKHKPDDAYFEQFIQPFDLTKDKLFRASLHKYKDSIFVFFDIHHIIHDGYSMEVFNKDFIDLLECREVKKELGHYSDILKAADDIDVKDYKITYDKLGETLDEPYTKILCDSDHDSKDESLVGKHISKCLPSKTVYKIAKNCNVSADCVIHYFFIQTLLDFTNNKHIITDYFFNRRFHPGLVRTIANFAMPIPFKYEPDLENDTFSEIKRFNDIRHDLTSFYKYTLNIQKIIVKNINYDCSISYNYLGKHKFATYPSSNINYDKIDINQAVTPKYKRKKVKPKGLSFYVYKENSDFTIQFSYLSKFYSKDKLEQILDTISDYVDTCASNI